MAARKKQLITILIVAAWTSLVFVIQFSAEHEFAAPAPSSVSAMDDPLTASLIWSLPVVLFGAVLFWWFSGLKEKK
jgi:hypothetical protein